MSIWDVPRNYVLIYVIFDFLPDNCQKMKQYIIVSYEAIKEIYENTQEYCTFTRESSRMKFVI